MNKIFQIFKRELKTTRRDSMAMLIAILPIVLAIAITQFAPGLNDTTVNLAMLKSDTVHIEYMEQFAKVETFDNLDEIIERVNKRDNIAGLLAKADNYQIFLQGDEPQVVEDYTKTLNALYELGSSIEGTTATMFTFGHTVSPIKTMLVNMLISITIMLSGMLIAISIVGEKSDNTINAINVTPVSQNMFVIGKSMMGGFIAMLSIVAALFITGYYDINWFMVLLVGATSLILALVIGFVQGLASDDVIEAAANVKIIMLPIAGSIAGYELLADKWQWTMYWSPFYWAYKANQLVLTKTADWPTILFCTAIVLGLSLLVFFAFRPKIREGLS